jgi:hypothetical protein
MVSSGVFAQAGSRDSAEPGEPAIVDQYLLWAEQAIAAGRWTQAREALERAADFSGVSSDISYLLALVRARGGENRGAILEAIGRACEANRWSSYSEAQARLLEADQLIALRRYSAALTALERAGESADAATLRLAALRGRAETGEDTPAWTAAGTAGFLRQMLDTMNRYPRDSRPLRLLFEYERGRNPGEMDQALVDLALRRLPHLIETDTELGWMAAPFIRDRAEAGRLVAAYRAGGIARTGTANFWPNPASIAPALELGLISEEAAAGELFSAPVTPNGTGTIDRAWILAVSDLIHGAEGRKLFAEQLLSFTGIIIADDDRDGYPESRAQYRDGMLQEYSFDADQDGLADFSLFFGAGDVRWAEQTAPPEAAAGTSALPAIPVKSGGLPKALILWERYPAVQRVMLDNTIYLPAPDSFQFAPVRFVELAGGGGYPGLHYPRWNVDAPRINRRSLAAASVTIQRPSVEFRGAQEQIYLKDGIPFRAEEILNGIAVSETIFEKGWPVIQYLDLDLDSRMETVRRFRRPPSGGADPLQYRWYIESIERDFNGDGKFEYGEVYRADGSVVYSWDMDGDGIREYSEIKRNGENKQ